MVGKSSPIRRTTSTKSLSSTSSSLSPRKLLLRKQQSLSTNNKTYNQLLDDDDEHDSEEEESKKQTRLTRTSSTSKLLTVSSSSTTTNFLHLNHNQNHHKDDNLLVHNQRILKSEQTSSTSTIGHHFNDDGFNLTNDTEHLLHCFGACNPQTTTTTIESASTRSFWNDLIIESEEHDHHHHHQNDTIDNDPFRVWFDNSMNFNETTGDTGDDTTTMMNTSRTKRFITRSHGVPRDMNEALGGGLLSTSSFKQIQSSSPSRPNLLVMEHKRSRRQVLELLQNAESVMTIEQRRSTDSGDGNGNDNDPHENERTIIRAVDSSVTDSETFVDSAPVSIVEIVDDDDDTTTGSTNDDSTNDSSTLNLDDSVTRLKWDMERKTMMEQIKTQEAHIKELHQHLRQLEQQLVVTETGAPSPGSDAKIGMSSKEDGTAVTAAAATSTVSNTISRQQRLQDEIRKEEEMLAAIMGTSCSLTHKNSGKKKKSSSPKKKQHHKHKKFSATLKQALPTSHKAETNGSFEFGTLGYAIEKKQRKKDVLAETYRGGVTARKTLDIPGLGIGTAESANLLHSPHSGTLLHNTSDRQLSDSIAAAAAAAASSPEQQPISRHSTGKINFFTVKKKDLWNAMAQDASIQTLKSASGVAPPVIPEEAEGPCLSTSRCHSEEPEKIRFTKSLDSLEEPSGS